MKAQNLFALAWTICKYAVKKFGGKTRDYFMMALKYAWQQFKNGTIKNPADTLKSDYMNLLLQYTLAITFIKKDGSTRVIYGSLKSIYTDNLFSNTGKTRFVPDYQVCLVDTEINEFRSFTLDSVTSYCIV